MHASERGERAYKYKMFVYSHFNDAISVNILKTETKICYFWIFFAGRIESSGRPDLARGPPFKNRGSKTYVDVKTNKQTNIKMVLNGNIKLNFDTSLQYSYLARKVHVQLFMRVLSK